MLLSHLAAEWLLSRFRALNENSQYHLNWEIFQLISLCYLQFRLDIVISNFSTLFHSIENVFTLKMIGGAFK